MKSTRRYSLFPGMTNLLLWKYQLSVGSWYYFKLNHDSFCTHLSIWSDVYLILSFICCFLPGLFDLYVKFYNLDPECDVILECGYWSSSWLLIQNLEHATTKNVHSCSHALASCRMAVLEWGEDLSNQLGPGLFFVAILYLLLFWFLNIVLLFLGSLVLLDTHNIASVVLPLLLALKTTCMPLLSDVPHSWSKRKL
jgi:hypothetical protein